MTDPQTTTDENRRDALREVALALADFVDSYDRCIDKLYNPESKIFGLYLDFSLIDGSARRAKDALKILERLK